MLQGRTRKGSKCPYDECPYKELDGVQSYDEYVDSISPLPIATLMAILCKPERIEPDLNKLLDSVEAES